MCTIEILTLFEALAYLGVFIVSTFMALEEINCYNRTTLSVFEISS